MGYQKTTRDIIGTRDVCDHAGPVLIGRDSRKEIFETKRKIIKFEKSGGISGKSRGEKIAATALPLRFFE